MPTKGIIRNSRQKDFIQSSLQTNTIKDNHSSRGFAELKNELLVVSDRNRIFSLTWQQFMAVLVFASSVTILILLRA